ncbi:winged-helix domain-containing protein [Haloferax larsenii]|uniref:Ribonuclease R winged-helix domain-containing protein n=1 Tax=Haloferax larsenii TaxID=302484 RepID=A0A1H7N7J0_HALLR|nr:winged-helix domain-containing protein [Haloferax larsenii]SEL19562.1 Ribonuclease R winged-helix domain-containing protein [Haloferax larsenii]
MSEIDSHLYDTTNGNNCEVPELHTILQVTRDLGVVGEEDTCLTVATASINGGLESGGGLFVLYSPARGGKDFTLRKTLEAIYGPGMVYEHPTDESETARYYSAKEANKYDIHIVGDLARVNEGTEKMLKDWGEGNDSERKVTDITKSPDDDDRTETMVLECPRIVFATMATDNRNADMNDFPELLKRAFMQSVDTTKEQTERVIKRKAEEHAGQVTLNVDPVERARIRQYFENIPVRLFTDNVNNKVAKPGMVEIARQTIEEGRMMPTEFNEARFDFDRLASMMGNMALLHHADRMTVDTGRGLVLLATPVDYWYTMQIMGNNMVMSALNLTDEDQAILKLLNELDYAPARKDIQQELRRLGHNIRDSDVRRSLDSMRESGYITEHSGSPLTYSISDFASVTDVNVSLDYSQIVQAAADEVRNIQGIEDVVADEYVSRYCDGSGTIAIHPFNGEAVDITEDDTLGEMTSQASKTTKAIVKGEDVDDEMASIFEEEPVYAQKQKDAESQQTLGGTLE